ncbi:MAG: SemiSWEET family transporter [Patescibacteria group bacterium]
MNPELVGFLAGFLTSINLLPQIVQSIRTRSVGDVSLAMLVIYDLGLGLWVVYGILILRPAIIVMDGSAFLASLLMTYIKYKYQ